MRAPPIPPVQLVTGAWRDAADLERRVAAALSGGIRWIQLRARGLAARDLAAAARLLAPMADAAGALLVVNDRADVAAAAGAGGVHLPEAGLAPGDARRCFDAAGHSPRWLARSVHSDRAIEEEVVDGDVDAFQFGPVFETPSKRAFGAPQGLEALARAARAAHARGALLVAVGGITAERVAACRGAGADAVAVIGAVWDAPDPARAARAFVEAAAWKPVRPPGRR